MNVKHKIVFTIIPLLILSTKNQAQANSRPTIYDTCHFLDQFIGNWQYVNGQDTIRMTFRKHRSHSYIFNSVTDELYCWLEYKKGSAVIESTYQYRNMYLPYEYDDTAFDATKYHANFFIQDGCNPNSKTFGGYLDDNKNNGYHCEARGTLNAAGNQISWYQYGAGGFVDPARPLGPMTLPQNFVLTKQ